MDTNYRLLAGDVAGRIVARVPRPRIVAISGGQGTGKSTLAASLARAFAERGVRADVLALDDFYLTRAEREALAVAIHPLYVTRGAPGTHDIARLLAALDDAFEPGQFTVPVFDKGRDDRSPVSRVLEGPLDVVILEGWCLGARPQPVAALEVPANALERDEDAQARWRRAVNGALSGDYQVLNARIDFLVYLEVQDMATVLRWRTDQERSVDPARQMGAARLARFVAHYERLTRWMATDLPHRADLVVHLGADRSYSVQGAGSRV